MIGRIIEIISRFFRETIWQDRVGTKSAWRFGRRLLQVSFLVGKHFNTDKGFLRASALSYTTLLSLVPLLAFAFSVLKGLGAEEQFRSHLFGVDEAVEAVEPGELGGVLEAGEVVEQEAVVQERAEAADGGSTASAAVSAGRAKKKSTSIIDRLTGGRPEVAERVISYVEETDFTALGIFGLAILLWTVIKVLSTVEDTFNSIWGVLRPRTWLRKFSDYTSVMVIAPVLLLTAIGFSTYLLKNPLADSGVTATLWEYVEQIVKWTGPALLTWASFTAFYVFMPNKSVKFTAALTGGIAGGTLWMVAFWGYTGFNIGVAKFNVLYTSFAALPIFLVWVYVSWLVVIFGAEVAFAQEHIETYRKSMEELDLSGRAREKLSLRLFLEIAGAFTKGEDAPDDDAMSETLNVPVRSIREVLAVLSEAGLVALVDAGGMQGVKPARALSTISPQTVLRAVREAGDPMPPAADDPAWSESERLEGSFETSLSSADLEKSFADILGAC